MSALVSSRRAAELLGLSTARLANLRTVGDGPRGWTRLAATVVVYPLDAVEQYRAEREARAAAALPALRERMARARAARRASNERAAP